MGSQAKITKCPKKHNHLKQRPKSGHRPKEAKLLETACQQFKIRIISILKEIKKNISNLEQVQDVGKNNQMEILNTKKC